MAVQNHPQLSMQFSPDPWRIAAVLDTTLLVDRTVIVNQDLNGDWGGQKVVETSKSVRVALNDALGENGIGMVLQDLKHLQHQYLIKEQNPCQVHVTSYRERLQFFKKLQKHLGDTVLPRIEKILSEKKLRDKLANRKSDTQRVFTFLKADSAEALTSIFEKYQEYFQEQQQLFKDLKTKKHQLDKVIKKFEGYKKTVFEPYVQGVIGEVEEKLPLPLNLKPGLIAQPQQLEPEILSLEMKEDPIGIEEALDELEKIIAPNSLSKAVLDSYNEVQWGSEGVTPQFILPEVREFSAQLDALRGAIPKIVTMKGRIDHYLKEKKLRLDCPIVECKKVFSVLSDPHAGDKIRVIVLAFLNHRKKARAQLERLKTLLVSFHHPKILAKIDKDLNWIYRIASFGRKLTKGERLRYSIFGVSARP